MMITELKYSNTNTFLVEGSSGSLLFDTGWAGTFPLLCKALGQKGKRLQDISMLVISHFHPDHCGIAQNIADAGIQLIAADIQLPFMHNADKVFAKEKRTDFTPIDDSGVKVITLCESRPLLKTLGIDGELISTKGHSDDSITLWLDKERTLLVGDLNPLYELELHKDTDIYESWQRLLALKPKTVLYGHARPAILDRGLFSKPSAAGDIYSLVKKIARLVDKGCTPEQIADKTGADTQFITDVTRMYVTHPGVSVQGILDRIEIKGK